MELGEGLGDQSLFLQIWRGHGGAFLPRKALQGSTWFQSSILLLLNPERNKGRARKKIKFLIERFITNLARELGFRGLGFTMSSPIYSSSRFHDC